MKLARYNYPSLLNDFDSWFSGADQPLAAHFSRLFDGLGSLAPAAVGNRLPVDLFEDESNFYVRFEMPGVKKDEVKIEAEGDVLNVSFERKSEVEGRSQQTAASRSVRLPDGVDTGRVSAKLEDGLLTVSVAKSEAKKPRVIEIG